ncbi:MAG: glycosyltransferase [Lachnospiraceae bacterium]|nr:glycosyltransferase [Lachnospiraceae bacterium]
MKILWLCNIMLPKIAKSLSMPYRSTSGWLTGLSEELQKQKDVSFIAVFPVSAQAVPLEDTTEGIEYYGFPWNGKDFTCSEKMVDYFSYVLERTKPDLIHIFGTEFPHTLAMVKACENRELLSRTVISIQGLVSVYAEHYLAALPERVVHAYTFRDFVKRDNIVWAQKKYRLRGILEREALQKASHVIGRTDWDRACMEMINPKAAYSCCNETLRKSFYEKSWSLETCERHSIFVSQWEYPIKGFHLLLLAMPGLLKRYPDLKVYTTGKSPFERTGLGERLKETSYLVYIKKMIKKCQLKDHIIFMGGELDEPSMCQAFLRAHVFLSPSSIENSPNSLGEAMILGVPCVSSDVGGVRNMLVHGEEGFLYPYDEYYMIGYYISCIFEEDSLALRFSAKGRQHAQRTHDPRKNLQDLRRVYDEIVQ